MMRSKTIKLIFFLFFVSGTAGLIYEIVWIRMLVLVFGNSTNSIVAVISAFLGGLALGSLLFGRWSKDKTPTELLRIYSFLEWGVGLTAALSLVLLHNVVPFYSLFSDGASVTTGLLLIKFVLTIAVLLLPTTLMGGTLPILVAATRSHFPGIDENVSALYATNTFGGAVGVVLSGFVFLELLGLTATLLFAISLNLLLGLGAYFISASGEDNRAKSTADLPSATPSMREGTILLIFGFSGLISISYEVLWTRILTPTTGTFVYAFALILAIYLLGVAGGSLIYNALFSNFRKKNFLFILSQIGIGCFALGSVFLTSNFIHLSRQLTVITTILPATLFMGMSFPAVLVLLRPDQSHGSLVGRAYFSNTVGSICGGFLTSFLLIPFVGSTQSVILLSSLNFLLGLALLIIEFRLLPPILRIASLGLLCISLTFSGWVFIAKRGSLLERTTQQRIKWAQTHMAKYYFKEDETASVLGFNDKDKTVGLFIDGVETTTRVLETKLMAHLPVALHTDPKDMLIVAFGMGSTFRSALLHPELNVDAIELSSSVPKMFKLFFPDADRVLSNPRGKIIINDGRNYVALTHKKYDIVTIDPPPPFNAAGTTVLYSENFYKQIQKTLKPEGLVSQWVYFGSRQDDIGMAMKSFVDVFPYVQAFLSPSATEGVYLVGSSSPIQFKERRVREVFSSEVVKTDLKEASSTLQLEDLKAMLIADRKQLTPFLTAYSPVTDDHPGTEYFIVRHLLTNFPSMTRELLRKNIK